MTLRLFLAGDVMPARGIDQILPHAGDPRLYEPWMNDARDYVRLAEQRNGRVPRPVDFAYVWGVALDILARQRPDLRLINLECAVTARGRPAAKGIHYRLHPGNLPLLEAAAIDGCGLANNHVLDWGPDGLRDTLTHLEHRALRHAGAGHDLAEAEAPAIFPLEDDRRLLLFARATDDCGVPGDWAASDRRPGVARLAELDSIRLAHLGRLISAARQPGDRVVLSIHWGGNWGYIVPEEQRRFAHRLIDEAGVDLVYGHSSHHPKGFEIHHGRLILYGCGDLINDYEGIEGHEGFRSELTLLYFPELDDQGRLSRLQLAPVRLRHLHLEQPNEHDRHWLRETLERECAELGNVGKLIEGDAGVWEWRAEP